MQLVIRFVAEKCATTSKILQVISPAQHDSSNFVSSCRLYIYVFTRHFELFVFCAALAPPRAVPLLNTKRTAQNPHLTLGTTNHGKNMVKDDPV